jgi:hypothetical protein
MSLGLPIPEESPYKTMRKSGSRILANLLISNSYFGSVGTATAFEMCPFHAPLAACLCKLGAAFVMSLFSLRPRFFARATDA